MTERTPIERLPGGLNRSLVKAWRLQCPVRLENKHVCGLYVEPTRGIFYARVPEQADGTLYAADTRSELDKQVRAALKAWADDAADLEAAERVWERRIRIRYSGGSKRVGEIVTAKGETINHHRDTRMPHDAVVCTEVGALTFSRYERSVQPDGKRYDLREWQGDHEARLASWAELSPQEKDSHYGCRPTRGRRVEWIASPRQSWSAPEYRDVAWDPATWAQLSAFVARFAQLHDALNGYLLKADEKLFLRQLGSSGSFLRQLAASERTSDDG